MKRYFATTKLDPCLRSIVSHLVESETGGLVAWQDMEDSFKGAASEFVAGKVLSPKSESDKAWNEAVDRCVRILKNYEKGEGLLQPK